MKLTIQAGIAMLVTSLFVFACNTPAPKDGEVVTKQTQGELTPDAVIADFKAGNERFLAGKLTNYDDAAQVQKTATGQFPKGIILSCVDSRVPAERVLDQAIGDVFVARVAGNFINQDILGSMEFATKVSGSKVIKVLGHEKCGAVKAAISDVKLGNITPMLTKIKPAVEKAAKGFEGIKTVKNERFVSLVGETNVRVAMDEIRARSPIIADLEKQGKVKIVGALYNIETGKVRYLN